MAGLKNTATLSRGAAHPDLRPFTGNGSRSEKTDQRQHWLQKAESFHQQALLLAEQGNCDASARLILQALDCERRAGGLGPQVLQLIKPRD